jgi:molybdenum cofactor cytidylyltransferase
MPGHAIIPRVSDLVRKSESRSEVGAIVVAAGLSRRMGQFKLLMPWGQQTVIGQVIATLEASQDLAEIVVVTGHRAVEVEGALTGRACRTTFNELYAQGEMISSVRAGLAALASSAQVALLCLGDQPQMQVETVHSIVAAASSGGACADDSCPGIVIPSYTRRAGHPILLPRWLWPEIFETPTDLRSVINAHRQQVRYLPVETASVLADLDTIEDYRQWNPSTTSSPS